MNRVSFRCKNCGKVLEQNIMPMKHAVLGTAYKINRSADCCKDSEYIDGHGYVESMENRSCWSFLPSITP